MTSKPIVLVVDDERQNLEMAGRVLRELDTDVIFAASGEEALKTLQATVPFLIMMDIVMPEMSGFDVHKKIAVMERVKDVPIIYLTGRNEVKDIIKGFNLGAKDYIAKPFIRAELIARVQSQLIAWKQERQLAALKHDLEHRVRKKTRDIGATNKKLNDYNAALHVLIDKNFKDKEQMKKLLKAKIRELISPYLANLKSTKLSGPQQALVDILENNVFKIMEKRDKGLTDFGLTHKEQTIANLIGQGKTSQEISSLLNISESTTNFHRINIRKKLGIYNQKKNLQVYLKQIAG